MAVTERERVFVSYPRWSDNVPVSVEELSFAIASDWRRSVPITTAAPYPNEA